MYNNNIKQQNTRTIQMITFNDIQKLVNELDVNIVKASKNFEHDPYDDGMFPIEEDALKAIKKLMKKHGWKLIKKAFVISDEEEWKGEIKYGAKFVQDDMKIVLIFDHNFDKGQVESIALQIVPN